MKYCGVVTPFRGVKVYTNPAIGMPGYVHEKALKELTCMMLRDLLDEGIIVKLAGDFHWEWTLQNNCCLICQGF